MAQYPYIVRRVGWGYFDIPIIVKFKKWTGLKPMKLEHELTFEEGGKSSAFVIELEEGVIEKGCKDAKRIIELATM